MVNNLKRKPIKGKYDDDKDYIKLLIDNAEYNKCLQYCISAVHKLKDNIVSTNDNYFMWFLLKRMGDCLYELKEYRKSISALIKSEQYANDEEYKIKTIWFQALCYKAMNCSDVALQMFNTCIAFYDNENMPDMVVTIRMCMAHILNDESIVLESIDFTKKYLNDINITKDPNVEYDRYLDEGYAILSKIYLTKGNQLMAYKAYYEINNRSQFTELRKELTKD